MDDAKIAAMTLLDFDCSIEVAHKCSTDVTERNKCGCFQFLLPCHAGAYSTSSTSIPAEDHGLDIENLTSFLHQHAREGNVEELEALLNKHAQLVNMPDKDGVSVSTSTNCRYHQLLFHK
ncbi:hypothetical protein Aduo_012734 [Ancylostoma duodenale]